MKNKDKAEAIMEVAEQAQAGNLQMMYLTLSIIVFFLVIIGGLLLYIDRTRQSNFKEYQKEQKERNRRQDDIMEQNNKLIRQNCEILAVHDSEIKNIKQSA